jgi:predicted DNA repair protein MutK
MDDVVVMSKIATKKQRDIRDDLAVNAEKASDLFPLEKPVLWAITKGSF